MRGVPRTKAWLLWASVVVVLCAAAGCDRDEGSSTDSQKRTVKLGSSGLTYLYVDSKGGLQPVSSLSEVPLAVRGATAMWNSRSGWERPSGDKEFVADLLGADSGDEVTAKTRPQSWMRQANKAGRTAARLGLDIKQRAERMARWADHKPWLWRVGSAKPPTYILGTISSASIDGLGELDPAVRRAYRQSDNIMLPLDPSEANSKTLIRYGRRNQPVDLRDEISDEAFQVLVQRLGDRIAPRRMSFLEPWLLLREFARDIRPGTKGGISGPAEATNRLNSRIFRQIQISAKADGKKITYIYTQSEFHAAKQKATDYEHIERVAENVEEVRVRFNMFQEAYRTRNVEGLKSNLIEPSAAWPADWPLEKRELTEVEREVRDELTAAAESGNTFIVVPVDDMFGDSRRKVRELLEQDGISVELID